MNQSRNKTLSILKRLKLLSVSYKNGNSAYWERLKKNLEKDFNQLSRGGVARHFGEAALFYDYTYPDKVLPNSRDRDGEDLLPEDVAAILGAPAENITTTEIKKEKPKIERRTLWD